MTTFAGGRLELRRGDCLEIMDSMPEGSVDSIVTDPPYHLLSTVKRFAKTGGADRRLSKGFMGKEWDGGDIAFCPETWAKVLRVLKPGGHLVAFSAPKCQHRMVCAIEDAGFEIRDGLMWLFGTGFPKSHNLGNGLGTALKPAYEPICLARKPIEGTNAANVMKWGVGGLNIDGCRVEAGDKMPAPVGWYGGSTIGPIGHKGVRDGSQDALGRWPANIVHDGSNEVVAAFPDSKGQLAAVGSAARYFYSAKASKHDRAGSKHPTVKPINLMRWLCRLVTPPGGLILDPFAGSGTTGTAAHLEGFRAILCEREEEYQQDIVNRLREIASEDGAETDLFAGAEGWL